MSTEPRANDVLAGELERIVHNVASRLYRPGVALGFDDLVQIGRLAASRAAPTHDGRRRGRATFVAQAVGWRIREAYRRESRQPQPAADDGAVDEIAAATPRRDFASDAVLQDSQLRDSPALGP